MIAGAAATLVGAQIVQLGLFARAYAVLYLGDRDPVLERGWTRSGSSMASCSESRSS